MSSKRAASTTVATWVLSPISARTNSTSVAPKAPSLNQGLSPSSSLSGIRIHSPTATNEAATAQRSTSALTRPESQSPSQAESAWLTRVATKMPAMIGQCWRTKREASTSDSNWVLSPISATATEKVEVRNASIERTSGAENGQWHATAPPRGDRNTPKVSPGAGPCALHCDRHGLRQVC